MPDNFIEKYQHSLAAELLAKVQTSQGWLHDRLLPPATARAEVRDRLQQQLAIYRNNVMYSLTRAMADQFPVVNKVVGEAFFMALAREYIQASPPEDPVLTFIGDTFPAYISQHEHCRPLPYLHDLAKLEWLCQKALHAADNPVLQPRELSTLPQEQLADCKLVLQDSVSLMTSPYPVVRIWEENLKDDPDTIDLSGAEPAFALVYRKGFTVNVINLQEHAFDLLYFIQQDMTISDSWESVSAQHAIDDRELPGILAWLLGLGLFSSIRIKAQPETRP